MLAGIARSLRIIVSGLLIVFVTVTPSVATANVIGDFFEKIGRSISNLHKGATHPTNKKPAHAANQNSRSTPPAGNAKLQQSPSPQPRAIASATPADVRPARLAPALPHGQRDVPYGVAVPNMPGMVTSPYAPQQGFVDVRAFPSSTEVIDPFTGKIFLTP
jgi:hypothetical protein